MDISDAAFQADLPESDMQIAATEDVAPAKARSIEPASVAADTWSKHDFAPTVRPKMNALPEDDPLLGLERAFRAFGRKDALLKMGGRVTEVTATHYKVRGISNEVKLGDIVESPRQHSQSAGEVVQITLDDVLVSPFGQSSGISVGDSVFGRGPLEIKPGSSWRGRVIDALGKPIDDRGALVPDDIQPPAQSATPGALARQRVEKPFLTGVKAIDIFTPLCFGQRLGIFAGSGVGKSTLLAMLAAASACALRVAEHFRDRGDRVLLLLDSITRFAHALREVAIGTGEPPVARGYPASVFTDMPKLLERAGPGASGAGSITAILSVLVDGDDHNDPVADSVRGILDGHIVLDRAIAEQGRYPPVNPLSSISRLASKAWREDQKALVMKLRSMIARYEDTRDIRLIGAYQPGVDAELDMAVAQVPMIYQALCQSPKDPPSKDPFADLARHLKPQEKAHVATLA